MRPIIEYANEAIRLTDLARQTPAPGARKSLLLLAAHYRDIANGIVSASDEDEEALTKSNRKRRRRKSAMLRAMPQMPDILV